MKQPFLTFPLALAVLVPSVSIGAAAFALNDGPEPPASPSTRPAHAAVDVRRCLACGEEIRGSGLTVDEGAFHAEHFRCDHCKRAIEGPYALLGTRYLHYACAVDLTARRCAVCEQVMVNVVGLEDFWGNVYHAEHQDEVPQCDYCGRLFADSLGNRGRRYRDGRTVCGLCLPTAVRDVRRAEALLAETAAQLARHGLAIEPDRVRLQLVDRHRLAELADAAHAGARGVTVFRTVDPGRDLPKKTDRNVYLLDGMPETEVRATLAHELVHVWQGEQRRLGADPAFLEGSCNYATRLVLADDRDDRARYLLKTLDDDPDPIYGEGYRRVRRFAEDRGHAAWIERLLHADTLPAGY